MTNELLHVDLFSGIGAFSLGFEAEGFRTIAFAEIDEYASAVLRKHWPHVPNYGDIRNVPAIPCTVLTGGFPCQPFSIAGRKLGENDPRHLWPSMLDVIERCQPDWVVGENVVNIKNMVLSRCLDDLAKRGYQSKAFDIPNCAAGLQSVERHVWIIAAANDIRRQRIGLQSLQNLTPFETQLQGGHKGDISRWNLSESRVCRVGERFPGRMDRLKTLGNAVPPQVAQIIARSIKEQILNA